MDEETSELIVLWVLTVTAVAIMVARLIMKWDRLHRLELGEYLTIAAIVSVLLRSSVETVAMIWGTNQMPASYRAKHHFTSDEIERREIAAKLTIVNRVFYTVYIWLQKCVVMCVVQQLLKGLELYGILRMYWTTMALTFMVSVIMCMVECSPFQLYWQVIPDPGTCAAGSLQLLVFSILEILTDIMLMVLPIRHLAKIQRPWLAKVRLIVLFTVGITIIAVTLARLLMNQLRYHRSGASHNIANVEIFFAAFVANSPPIYGLLNMKYGNSSQRSKSNHKNGSNASGGRQLGTLASIRTVAKRQSVHLSDWSNSPGPRRNVEVDSDEELIIQYPGKVVPSTLSNKYVNRQV